MPNGLWPWSIWVSVGLCLEIWGVWGNPRPMDTFSEWTLYVTRATTPVGFSVLTAIMVFLLAWFPGHVERLGRKHENR